MFNVRQIWDDIKRGENVDLYIVVIVAFGFTLLSVLGVPMEGVIAPLNVTVLGLLAFAMLHNRRALEALHQGMLSVTRGAISSDFPADFNSTIRNAKEVWLTGVHHASIMNEHYEVFEAMIRKGGTLRILQVNPDGHACGMAVMRFAGSVDDAQERARARSSLKVLSELKKIAPQKVEIRVIDYLLEYGACVVNPGDSSAIVYVQRYTFRTLGGGRKPKFVYRVSDGPWFELYRFEITALWQVSVPVGDDF